MRSKPASNQRMMAGGREEWPDRREASIGVTVSETSAEAMIASVTTIPNSLKSLPITPPINRMGMKTATSETDMDRMVPLTSAAPCKAASRMGRPFSCSRRMFSSMTMASSTTRPTDSVSPSSEILSML